MFFLEKDSVFKRSGDNILPRKQNTSMVFGEELESSKTKTAESLGPTILTDGGLENWVDANTPTSWIAGETAEGGTITKEETIVHAGGSIASAKFTTDGDGDGKYIYQVISGLTAGDNYRFKLWARNDTAGGLQFLIFNGVFGVDATEMYNFTSNAWEAVGAPTSDNYVEITLDGTYTLTTIEDFAVPTNGTLFLVIVATGTSGTIYLDDMSCQKVTPANSVVLAGVTNDSDAALLDSTDYALRVKTIGGTPTTVFGVKGDGTVEDNFGGLKVNVQAQVTAKSALSGYNGLKLLGTASVDVKTVAATKIFDGLTDIKVIPMFITQETTAATALNGDGTLTIGTNSTDYDNMVGTSSTYSTTVNEITYIDTPFKASGTNEDIYVKVSGADTGTSGTVKVYLFGVLA